MEVLVADRSEVHNDVVIGSIVNIPYDSIRREHAIYAALSEWKSDNSHRAELTVEQFENKVLLPYNYPLLRKGAEPVDDITVMVIEDLSESMREAKKRYWEQQQSGESDMATFLSEFYDHAHQGYSMAHNIGYSVFHLYRAEDAKILGSHSWLLEPTEILHPLY